MHILWTKTAETSGPYNTSVTWACHMETDKTLDKRAQKYAMNAYQDETHFIHNCLH